MPLERHWSSTPWRAAARTVSAPNTPVQTRRSSASLLPVAGTAMAWRAYSTDFSSGFMASSWNTTAARGAGARPARRSGTGGDARTPPGPRSLRGMYGDMLGELARHAGHGDILREQILAPGGSPT